MTKRIVWLALVIAVAASIASACPTCSETLTDGVRPSSVARGFFWSIITMLVVPFSLVGGIGFLIWRKSRSHAPLGN